MLIGCFSIVSKRLSQRSIVWLGLILGFSLLVSACGPDKTIGYQGRLTDAAGNPINGNKTIIFRLYTCASGSGGGCSKVFEKSATVNLVNGLFNYEIGKDVVDAYNLAGLDPASFAQPLWLEVEVDGQTLTPRQKLLGAPYAMTLSGGAVIGSKHEGNGAGGSDDTDINYGALTVVGGNGGTALVLGVTSGATGDLIRACSGVIGASRGCPDLEFQVMANGNVKADGSFASPASDFAELIALDASQGSAEPGDVLVISHEIDRAVALSTSPNSTAIAGVYSTEPGFIGGGGAEEVDPNRIPVAIVGIVPVKVSAENGPILRGDLLTSASLPGYAMKATQILPGAILGKAMGELQSGTGVIEVLLLLK